jgi:NitT/TauT family transport system ATP-binding protein
LVLPASGGEVEEMVSSIAGAVAAGTPVMAARGVSKVFPSKNGDVVALKDVDWAMEPGEFVALIGPSGCGKSTLLNLVAGLLKPTIGTVEYGGKPLVSVNTHVGYMTQKDSVFPWRTVLRNVALPLELRGVGKEEREAKAREFIKLVQLEGFESEYPSKLSGGMRKRVGLAQSLVAGPETILLDEPFGALDAMLKLALQAELMSMIDSPASSVKNVLLVTHDLDEAVTLADRVVIMSPRPGRIRTEIRVDLPRPRDPVTIRDSEDFQAKRREIWAYLQDEIRVE